MNRFHMCLVDRWGIVHAYVGRWDEKHVSQGSIERHFLAPRSSAYPIHCRMSGTTLHQLKKEIPVRRSGLT